MPARRSRNPPSDRTEEYALGLEPHRSAYGGARCAQIAAIPVQRGEGFNRQRSGCRAHPLGSTVSIDKSDDTPGFMLVCATPEDSTMVGTCKIAAISGRGYRRLQPARGRGRGSDAVAAAGAAQRSDRSHHRRPSRPHRQAHRRRHSHRVPQRRRRGALRDRSAERHGRAQRRSAARASASSSGSAFISATWSRKATAI